MDLGEKKKILTYFQTKKKTKTSNIISMILNFILQHLKHKISK